MKQIKSITGKILFEVKKEKSAKELLKQAVGQNTDLTYSNLKGCELEGADLEINKIKHSFQIVPEEGSFVAWKKGESNCILKLLISDKAKRHNYLVGRKCRAEYVDVLKIWNSKGYEIKECQNAPYGTHVQYTVGKRTYADSYDPDPRIECSNGIHFFLTRKEAEEW